MGDLPKPVGQFLQDWLQRRFVFGYILVDAEGRVDSWGGALDKLGLPALEKDRPISDQLIFTEGLFPAETPRLYLPMVKIDANRSLDVHLFQTKQGHGLFLVDVTEKDKAIAQWQQKANALTLKLDRKAKETARIAENNSDLFQALDIAAMRCRQDGMFELIGQAPVWLAQYCDRLDDGQAFSLGSENGFSFLGHFLAEADAFWRRNQVGCQKSGLWIEADRDGREQFFEAIAVTTNHDHILLLTRNLSQFEEKQRIIQAGREIAMEKGVLQRLERKLTASRKAMEEQVRKRTRQLHEANVRLTNELNWRQQLEREQAEMVRQLQQAQKMEAIGTLAGGIAHDFNNILSAILGYTELSLNEAEKNSALRNNLIQVLHATERARNLIRQILTFSRQSKHEKTPVRVKTIVQEALKLLRACLPASIEIEDQIGSTAHVLADPTQLHQVIMNLCTNAAQAMQPKGGILTLRLRGLTIHPNDMTAYPELQAGDHVELSVRDTGHGMDGKILERIFDPFFTTKAEGQGTGMGLSVVHGIVKSFRGAIQVTSQVGVGTLFRILLPAALPAGRGASKRIANMPGGNERILFIDDELVQVELASQMLGRLGYQVTGMSDSLAAIEKFTEIPDTFDLVISDMNMPKMNGWALTQQLRRVRSDIPIILCSGSSVNPQPQKPIDPLIQEYLSKPVPMIEMARAIRRVLDHR